MPPSGTHPSLNSPARSASLVFLACAGDASTYDSDVEDAERGRSLTQFCLDSLVLAVLVGVIDGLVMAAGLVIVGWSALVFLFAPSVAVFLAVVLWPIALIVTRALTVAYRRQFLGDRTFVVTTAVAGGAIGSLPGCYGVAVVGDGAFTGAVLAIGLVSGAIAGVRLAGLQITRSSGGTDATGDRSTGQVPRAMARSATTKRPPLRFVVQLGLRGLLALAGIWGLVGGFLWVAMALPAYDIDGPVPLANRVFWAGVGALLFLAGAIIFLVAIREIVRLVRDWCSAARPTAPGARDVVHI